MPESIGSLYVFVFLLPGFVGYLTLVRIYDRKIEDAFDKAALVILITAVSLVVVALVAKITLPDFDGRITWKVAKNFVLYVFPILTFVSAVVGGILGGIANSKFFSDLAIKIGFSSKTGHAAVLAAVIRKFPDGYFRIRFKDGGYVLGHPTLYSLDGEECCLFLEKPSIRRKRGQAAKTIPAQIPLVGHGVVIVNFDDVKYIEVV